MHAFLDWVDAPPIGPFDLAVVLSACAAVWLFQRALDRSLVRKARGRAIKDARIQHYFLRQSLMASRQERGADAPETQALMFGTVISWRDGHPNDLQADVHRDPMVTQAMEELHPVSELRM